MMRFRCAFLTKKDAEFAGQDDPLLASELQSRGWAIEAVDWRNESVNWADFDVVLVRSPWNYYLFPTEFRAAIARIEQSGVRLLHPRSTIEANIDKGYLSHLVAVGHPVVPTRFVPANNVELNSDSIHHWCREFSCDSIVVKPVVSAGSEKTFRLHQNATGEAPAIAVQAFRERTMMVQPFVSSVQSDGEYSLVFLDGTFHHAVRKVPKAGDFRVQVQHGGVYTKLEPDDWLISASQAILKDYVPETLYARVDWVRNSIHHNDSNRSPYLMMEVELIEPDLYLRFTEDGIRTYASILEKWLKVSCPSTASVDQPVLSEQRDPSDPMVSTEPQKPYEQLHPDSIVIERWAGLIFVAVLGLIALVIWGMLTIFVFPIWDYRCWLIGLSGIVLLGLLGVFVRMDPVWKFRNTRFRELPGGLELQRGYVWWHRIFVPRERIQHTDVIQGPLMRRFNIATLVINTAGTHEHSIAIEGLDFQRAEQLRASLLIKNPNTFHTVPTLGPTASVVDFVTNMDGE